MIAERGLVADVLAMQARQVGDPITSVVQTETDDATQHDLIMLDRTTVGTETRARMQSIRIAAWFSRHGARRRGTW
jgi:hypothetical protein